MSKDEELFRVFVASGKAYEREAGFRIWTKRIRPDLQGDRPGLKPFLQSITEVVPVISESGELLGHAAALRIDRQLIQRVLSKIAKGLYFLDTGEVLPGDVQIIVRDDDDLASLDSSLLDEAIRAAKRVDLGDGVVTYWRATEIDDPTASLNLLQFYQEKVFLTITLRRGT